MLNGESAKDLLVVGNEAMTGAAALDRLGWLRPRRIDQAEEALHRAEAGEMPR